MKSAEQILGYQSRSPEICGVCGRKATANVGYMAEQSDTKLWVCNLCTSIKGFKIMEDVHPLKLKQMEAAALQDAAADELNSLLKVFFEALERAGIKDLDALTEESYAVIVADIKGSTDYLAAVMTVFLGYTNAMRLAVTNA